MDKLPLTKDVADIHSKLAVEFLDQLILLNVRVRKCDTATDLIVIVRGLAAKCEFLAHLEQGYTLPKEG